MSADADHWWRNRREASVGSGDAWSGGGAAYRRWLRAGPASGRPQPARAEQAVSAIAVAQGSRSVPRAATSAWTRSAGGVARPLRKFAEAVLFVVTGVPLAQLGRRVRLRTVVGVGAASFAAIVFLAPLAWASRWDPCAAAEVALVDDAVGRGSRFAASKARAANWVGADGKLFSRGRVGRQIAAEEHAGWPPAIGCTALFWRARWEVSSFGGVTAVLTRARLFLR